MLKASLKIVRASVDCLTKPCAGAKGKKEKFTNGDSPAKGKKTYVEKFRNLFRRKKKERHNYAISGINEHNYQGTESSRPTVTVPVDVHWNRPENSFLQCSCTEFLSSLPLISSSSSWLLSSSSSSPRVHDVDEAFMTLRSTDLNCSMSTNHKNSLLLRPTKAHGQNHDGTSYFNVADLTSRLDSGHRAHMQSEFSGHAQASDVEEIRQFKLTDEVNAILYESGLSNSDLNLSDMIEPTSVSHQDTSAREQNVPQSTFNELENHKINEQSAEVSEDALDNNTGVKYFGDNFITEVTPSTPEDEAVTYDCSHKRCCSPGISPLWCSRVEAVYMAINGDMEFGCQAMDSIRVKQKVESSLDLSGFHDQCNMADSSHCISCPIMRSEELTCISNRAIPVQETSVFYQESCQNMCNLDMLELGCCKSYSGRERNSTDHSLHNGVVSCAAKADMSQHCQYSNSEPSYDTVKVELNLKRKRDEISQNQRTMTDWNEITDERHVTTLYPNSNDIQGTDEQDNSGSHVSVCNSLEYTGTQNTADPVTNVSLKFCFKSYNKQGENIEGHHFQQNNTQGGVNTPQSLMETEVVHPEPSLLTSVKFLRMREQPERPAETSAMQITHKEEAPQEKQTGSERVSSSSDIYSVLGHGFRYTDWGLCQNFVVYPIFRPELLNQLMNHELLRLCSYSNSYLPINSHMMATYLAQSGFYCLTRDGDVRCFSCGREYPGFLIGTPPENAHDRRCRHRQENIPLSTMTQGISAEQLDQYFTHYEGPAVLHEREQMGGGERYQSSAHEYRDNSGLLSTTARSQSSGYATGLSGATSAEHTLSVGHEEADSSFAEVPHNREEESDNRAHSEPLHAASNRPRNGSLPPDLNDLSGAIVSQESQREDSMQVYTSAASRPIDLNITQPPPPADNGGDRAEGGAVGGHDPATGQVNDLRRASYPQFASQQSRLASFRAWSADHSHRPEDLAAAGFFYAGYADCVRCFYCGVGLKYWRETDIPAYQHARFRPHCVYNILYKGQEYIDRVQEDVRQQGQAGGPEQGVGGIAPQAGLHQAPTEPEVPETGPMASAAAVAALGDGWSRDQVQRAVNHIMEELGENCLQPDLLADVLNNLQMEPFDLQEPDPNRADALSLSDEEEPLEGNDIRFRDDELQVSQTVPQRTQQTGAGDSAAHGAQAHIQQPAPVPLNPEEEMRVVEREHNYLMQRTTCSICHTQPVSCVFLPCGHVTACEPCADAAERCNLCNKSIIGTANIYLA